jgi:site-specific DNA-methyltransferase (adenine-specific)
MRIPHSLTGTVSGLLEGTIARKRDQAVLPAAPIVITKPQPGDIEVLGKLEARDALGAMAVAGIKAAVVMLDPWYRSKGAQGRAAFFTEVLPLISAAARVGQHVFVWGFPEALGRLIDQWPPMLKLESWLTWSYRNVPSRGKGWRANQQACLHLRHRNERMYPERFYNHRHLPMAAENRLDFKRGPFAAFEEALHSGFIGKSEQTGHPAQKPIKVITRLLSMTIQPGDLVVDPTAGSGTTGIAARRLGCAAILSDRSAQSIKIMRKRITAELQKRPTFPSR